MDFIILIAPALILIILWLARNLIITRLKSSVQYEFDAKLESLKSEIRESEERFKADLKAREVEISSMRNGVLTAMSNRQIALDKRRLEAVDQLWSSVTELNATRLFINVMGSIDYALIKNDAKARSDVMKLIEVVTTGVELKKMDVSGSRKARPFLSPMVWASFSAMLAILVHAIGTFEILKKGGDNGFMVNDTLDKLMRAALPELKDFPKSEDPSVYYNMINTLDEQLLKEINLMLTGHDLDKAEIDRASDILKYSNDISIEAEQATIKS